MEDILGILPEPESALLANCAHKHKEFDSLSVLQNAKQQTHDNEYNPIAY